MTRPQAPPEEPGFVDDLSSGAPMPDRINPGAPRQPRDLQPGESEEQARKRLHDSEFGAPAK